MVFERLGNLDVSPDQFTYIIQGASRCEIYLYSFSFQEAGLLKPKFIFVLGLHRINLGFISHPLNNYKLEFV